MLALKQQQKMIKVCSVLDGGSQCPKDETDWLTEWTLLLWAAGGSCDDYWAAAGLAAGARRRRQSSEEEPESPVLVAEGKTSEELQEILELLQATEWSFCLGHCRKSVRVLDKPMSRTASSKINTDCWAADILAVGFSHGVVSVMKLSEIMIISVVRWYMMWLYVSVSCLYSDLP